MFLIRYNVAIVLKNSNGTSKIIHELWNEKEIPTNGLEQYRRFILRVIKFLDKVCTIFIAQEERKYKGLEQ